MLLLKGKRAHFPWKGILLWKPNSNFNFLVNNTIKHLSARSNILQLWWNFFRSFCNTVIRHIWYGLGQMAHYLYWPFSNSVDCCQVLYLIWQKIPNDDWEEWGASMHMIIMWGKLYQLSTPYIKLSVRWYLFIFSRSFPCGSLSYINVLMTLASSGSKFGLVSPFFRSCCC